MSTTSTTIKNALTSRGIWGYDHVVESVARRLEPIEGPVGEGDLRSALVASGHVNLVPSAAPYFGSIAEALNQSRAEESHGTFEVTIGADTEGFDREYAATVIRQAADDAGLDPRQVEAALLKARLIDPEPEPEPEMDAPPSWAQRLIERVESLADFARSKGYRG